ncbi:MAG: hypothetical protein HZB26_18150 [Candidatus Hydrogenedentes bacterium]|nr:hypothetical protein [Candidatus Hydrogenedentota bacterium]
MSQDMRVWLRAGVCRFVGMAAAVALVFGTTAYAAEKASKKADKKADTTQQTDKPADKPADKAAPSGDLAAIALTLPDASFSSTPLAYVRANLETPGYKPREPFLAPKDVTDISKGKPVTSSAAPTTGKLEMVTDGDKQYADKAIVTLPAGTQWVQIDLGAANEIYAIVLWHYHAAQRVYFDTVVQVSDDPEFKKDVKTVYNNDDDNSSGLGVGKNNEYVETYEGKLIDTKGEKGRYVRCCSKGNTSDDFNHYIEVEVFGKPVK